MAVQLERSELADLLQQARPEWSRHDLSNAVAKCELIGCSSGQDLVDRIEAGTLNTELAKAGAKRFHRETLASVRRSFLGYQRAAVVSTPQTAVRQVADRAPAARLHAVRLAYAETGSAAGALRALGTVSDSASQAKEAAELAEQIA